MECSLLTLIQSAMDVDFGLCEKSELHVKLLWCAQKKKLFVGSTFSYLNFLTVLFLYAHSFWK